MHIRSHSKLFLYLVLYSPHTHTLKPPEDAGNLYSISPLPPLLPSHLSRSEMSGLDVGYHSAPVSGTAPNCARDLSYAFWSFLSVSTPLCFPGGGNQPRTILWNAKAGAAGWANAKKIMQEYPKKNTTFDINVEAVKLMLISFTRKNPHLFCNTSMSTSFVFEWFREDRTGATLGGLNQNWIPRQQSLLSAPFINDFFSITQVLQLTI